MNAQETKTAPTALPRVISTPKGTPSRYTIESVDDCGEYTITERLSSGDKVLHCVLDWSYPRDRDGLPLYMITELYRQNEADYLRSLLPEGSRVYVSTEHVSQSGMYRRLKLFALGEDGQRINITKSAAIVTRAQIGPCGTYGITGAGMDMHFAAVYDLSYQLYGDGYALKHESI